MQKLEKLNNNEQVTITKNGQHIFVGDCKEIDRTFRKGDGVFISPAIQSQEKTYEQEDEEIIRKFLHQGMPPVQNQVLVRPMKNRLPKLTQKEEKEQQD